VGAGGDPLALCRTRGGLYDRGKAELWCPHGLRVVRLVWFLRSAGHGSGLASRGLLGFAGLATGSPAARHAWNPPITSVALLRPRACSEAAASEEEYPSSQQMIQAT